MSERLDCIIGGNSTENGVMFQTAKVSIEVQKDGKVFYNNLTASDEEKNEEYNEKKRLEKKINIENSRAIEGVGKTKLKRKISKTFYKLKRRLRKFNDKVVKKYPELKRLNHKPTRFEKILCIFEALFSIILFVFHFKYVAIITSALALGFGARQTYVSNKFYKDKKATKSMHSAEHMVFNSYIAGVNGKKLKVKDASSISKYCGSNKLINFLFLEGINLIVSIFLGFWIPHLLILFVSLNKNKILPGNFLMYILQPLVLAKPTKEDIEIAYFALKLTLNADTIEKYSSMSKEIFKIIILATIKRIEDDAEGEGIEVPKCIKEI